MRSALPVRCVVTAPPGVCVSGQTLQVATSETGQQESTSNSQLVRAGSDPAGLAEGHWCQTGAPETQIGTDLAAMLAAALF